MPIDTDDSIHAIHRSLQNSHECTVNELGRNFYRNYAEYVKVAQEAEKFENDLNAMRAMISQLKGFSVEITGPRDIYVDLGANIEEIVSPSLIEQESIEASPELDSIDPELQAKMKRITDLIPDAAKFMNDTRAVLLESASMAVYLDKQWKPAQLWLLSNGCLIASRKAKVSLTQGVRHKLTFERFYPTDGLILANVSDTADLQNCFKLKNSDLGSVFVHTEEESVKSSWMQQIQTAISETLQEKNKKQQQSQNQAPAAFKSKTSAKPVHRRTSSACTTATGNRPALDIGLEGQEMSPDDANNMEKTLQDLSEALCCTNYDDAVNIVEKLKFDFERIDFTSPLVHSLKGKYLEMRSQLASYIFMEISDNLISRSRMSGHIQKLIVLGFVEEARERFLVSRSELIKEKTLKIQFYGNVFSSIALLASVTFESIEVSLDWYSESFREMTSMTTFVSWARNEVSRFCDIFSRQALRKDLAIDVLAACVMDSLEKCRGLGYSGLDLSIFLEDSLGETLKGALKARAAIHVLRVEEAISKDSFDLTIGTDRPDWPNEILPPNDNFEVTESLLRFVQSLQSYLSDILPLTQTPQLANFCVVAIYEFVNNFSDKFLRCFYEPERSYTQLCHIAANMESLALVLLPSLIDKMSASNHANLLDLQKRLTDTSEVLYSLISDRVAKSLVPPEFSDYSRNDVQPDNVSDWLRSAIPVLARLARDIPKSHKAKSVDDCVYKMLSAFHGALENKLVKFSGSSGLQRFGLDLKLLTHLTCEMLEEQTSDLYGKVFEMAINSAASGDLDAPIATNLQLDSLVTKLSEDFADISLDFTE